MVLYACAGRGKRLFSSFFAFAGKTVELFFELLDGTSTNATLSIAAMRLYQIDLPHLDFASRSILV